MNALRRQYPPYQDKRFLRYTKKWARIYDNSILYGELPLSRRNFSGSRCVRAAPDGIRQL